MLSFTLPSAQSVSNRITIPTYLHNRGTPTLQAVGFEDALGTRLLPSRLFSNASARAELSALIADTLPFANPYVMAGTPWLYKPAAGTAGATAVTPAWRDAVWLLSIRVGFEYNDTLADRTGRYQALSEHTQKFRDLAPESGSYFVSGIVLLMVVRHLGWS